MMPLLIRLRGFKLLKMKKFLLIFSVIPSLLLAQVPSSTIAKNPATGNLNSTSGFNITSASPVTVASGGVFNVASGGQISSTNPLYAYVGSGYLPPSPNILQTGISKDGINFGALNTVYSAGGSNTVFRVSVLCQPNDPSRHPLKINGYYWGAHSSGGNGNVNYITILKSFDLNTWTHVSDTTITGVSGTIFYSTTPNWYTPDGLNFYILLHVSNQSGIFNGTPGPGYITMTNPSSFLTGSNPTFGDFTTGLGIGTNYNGMSGPFLIGTTYVLFYDSDNLLYYSTSMSPLSGYGSAVQLPSHFQTDVVPNGFTATASDSSTAITLSGGSSSLISNTLYTINGTNIPSNDTFVFNGNLASAQTLSVATIGTVSGSVTLSSAIETCQPMLMPNGSWTLYFAASNTLRIYYSISSNVSGTNFTGATWSTALPLIFNGASIMNSGCPIQINNYDDIHTVLYASSVGGVLNSTNEYKGNNLFDEGIQIQSNLSNPYTLSRNVSSSYFQIQGSQSGHTGFQLLDYDGSEIAGFTGSGGTGSTIDGALSVGGILSGNGSGLVTGNAPLYLYAGAPNQVLQFFDGFNSSSFAPMVTSYGSKPTNNGVRDTCILTEGTDSYRHPVKISGNIQMAYTAGNLGTCGYFQLAKTFDYQHVNFVENVVPTGLTAAATTTIATTLNSATITLGSTTGLTSGRFYTITGNVNVPSGAGFLYNSGTGTTQTLDYQENYSTGFGATVLATATASPGPSCPLEFIVNCWSSSFIGDGTGNYYWLGQINQTNTGAGIGSPGIGYMQVTNVAAWKTGSLPIFGNFTPITIGGVSGGSGLNGPFGPQFIGGTWYLECDNTANCLYATASSFLGPYGTTNLISSNFGSGSHSSESSQLIQLGSSTWEFIYCDKNSVGGISQLLNYSILQSSLPFGSTWPTPIPLTLNASGTVAGSPITVNNYEDIHQILAAEATFPIGIYQGAFPATSVMFNDNRVDFYTGNSSVQGNNGIDSFRISNRDTEAFQNFTSYPALTLQGLQNGWGAAYSNPNAPSGSQTWVSVIDNSAGNFNLYTSTTNSGSIINGITLGSDVLVFDRSGDIGMAGIIDYKTSGNCITGSGTPTLGANCPATTLTAPYKWLKMETDDGSTVYVPAWK